MDYTNRDSIFAELQAAAISPVANKALFLLAAEIRGDYMDLLDRFNASVDARELLVRQVGRSAGDTDDMTDEDIRAGLRSLLVRKLDDESLTAAEIAQLKDVFGLASQVDQVEIAVTQFKCSECPRGGNDDT